MDYKLKYRKKTDYLHVEASGTRTPETLLSAAKDVVVACEKHGYNKVLADAQKMTGTLGTANRFYLVEDGFKKLRGPKRLKISIVDIEDNRSRFEFFETVARNRGFNLRIFANADKAILWLRSRK